ncbi:MAG TPA: transglycosylase SLT domain-containing protein [Caldimonas sp.]
MLQGAALVVALGCGATPRMVWAQGADATVLDAREALRKKDRNRLASDRAVAAAERNPLALWVDYWELSNRLGEAQQDELDAFAARWNGTYVEDRLRNDWLLELGRRRDWNNFAAEFPRFKMNDDREVACYALLVDHLQGKNVREAAPAAWLAQREADDGCALMATTLYAAKQLSAATAWTKARVSIDANRPRAARQAVLLVNAAAAKTVDEVIDSPARYLRAATGNGRTGAELTALALMRMASSDADAAAALLNERWERALPPDLSAWAWAAVAKQTALKLQPEAADHFLRASKAAAKSGMSIDWPDDTLAWKVRAALRADNGRARWQQVVQAIDAMSASEQHESAWVYWKARALQALAKDSQDGESLRGLSRELLASLVGQLNFYGTLATEDAAQALALPLRPAPLTPAEVEAAGANPGLARALQLIAIGLRNEGVREWNFTLRGMSDRELLAAAQMACDREVWDRCINTSERTRAEVDMEQRFPTPFRKEVSARAREIGLDAAYVYGLIRQESRFIMDARSGVGASGLMQIMPATARWTAKKIGLAYTPGLLADRDTNLRLGTAYLKLVLDDFGGSQALAAAAYNAGPGRPRKWREGPWLEPAAWAESIPFAETRDYVKKVLSNATWYAAVLGGPATALKLRLGHAVGPAGAGAAPDKDLP